MNTYYSGGNREFGSSQKTVNIICGFLGFLPRIMGESNYD